MIVELFKKAETALAFSALIIIFLLLSLLFVTLFLRFNEWIKHIIKTYKRKHRFDKKPIAKCYCTDCKYSNPYLNCSCSKGYLNHSYDAWFCADAEPK